MIVWAVVVLGFVSCGTVFGATLDAVMWRLSFDYVFAPNYFKKQGMILGGFEGTVVAAIISVGNRSLPGWRKLGRHSIAAAGTCVACGLLGWLMGGAYGTWLGEEGARELAPVARVFACRGLASGALMGSLLAAAIMSNARRRGSVKD